MRPVWPCWDTCPHPWAPSPAWPVCQRAGRPPPRAWGAVPTLSPSPGPSNSQPSLPPRSTSGVASGQDPLPTPSDHTPWSSVRKLGLRVSPSLQAGPRADQRQSLVNPFRFCCDVIPVGGARAGTPHHRVVIQRGVHLIVHPHACGPMSTNFNAISPLRASSGKRESPAARWLPPVRSQNKDMPRFQGTLVCLSAPCRHGGDRILFQGKAWPGSKLLRRCDERCRAQHPLLRQLAQSPGACANSVHFTARAHSFCTPPPCLHAVQA